MKNGIYKHASAYAEDGIPCLRMYNIEDGRIVWKDIKRMRLTNSELDDYGLLPGDLLVNRVNSRELVGKTAPIPDGLGLCVFESKNIRLRLDQDRVDPKWVSYKLLLDGSRYFDRNAQQVVGMASINQGQLGDFPIPLPPLPEQRRIVARIEELFSRLDVGVAALRHAKAQLQRYRQSVLAAAVTGQLTQAWREQHPDTEPAEELLKRILEQRREQWTGRGKYKEPVAPTTDHDLPENWTSATSDQLVHFVTSGSRGWAEHYSEEGAIFLRIGNLEHEDIALDLDDIQRVMPPEGAEGSRTRVQTNDILISITADIGMVALVDTDIGEAYINQHVALARPSDEVNPRFLAWLLASKPTKAQWKLLQRGATKVGLGLDDIRAVQLGLPPLAEQHQIVAEVEARTSAIDHLEAELDRQITRSNRLRQSTLAAAFSGKLI
jgi:type I restriction enzyme S subunit